MFVHRAINIKKNGNYSVTTLKNGSRRFPLHTFKFQPFAGTIFHSMYPYHTIHYTLYPHHTYLERHWPGKEPLDLKCKSRIKYFQRLIAELNKEQDAFIAGKTNEKGEAVAPWIGAPNEDALREECLALSTVSYISWLFS